MSALPNETFDSINEWQRSAFPNATRLGILKHLKEEWQEFLYEEDSEKELIEAAELILLLCDFLQRCGRGAQYHIDSKMAICRSWDILPDGTGRHK